MKDKRFYYSKSGVYGWCVYDRQTNTPAYEACCDYLEPIADDEDGTIYVTPLCDSEYQAMRLCLRLNSAHRLGQTRGIWYRRGKK